MSTASESKEKSTTSLADVAKVSELKNLGWSVEGDDKTWMANEIAGEKRTIGPASSIKALHTQVMLASGPAAETSKGNGSAPKTVKVKGNQPILPATRNAVLEDLRKAILEYRSTTMSVLELRARQKEEKKTVMDMMHKFEDELSTDPETGFKYFQAEMVIAELEVEMKENLKTRTVDSF